MQPLIIIPTYNERENIAALLPAIRQEVPSADICVVDDNSPDGTGKYVAGMSQVDTQIHLLARQQKEGLGRAYQAAFTWALARAYDPICTMDADFSHAPSDLPRLISAAHPETVVVGSRYVAGGKIEGWTPQRYLLSWTANRLARYMLGLKPHDVTAGFKCYPRRFLALINETEVISPGYAFQVETLLRAKEHGFRIHEIPITFHDRTIGRSKVSRHELITSARSLVRLAASRRGK